MTVKDAICILQSLPPDAEFCFGDPSQRIEADLFWSDGAVFVRDVNIRRLETQQRIASGELIKQGGAINVRPDKKRLDRIIGARNAVQYAMESVMPPWSDATYANLNDITDAYCSLSDAWGRLVSIECDLCNVSGEPTAAGAPGVSP